MQSLNTPYHWISEKSNGIYDAMNKGVNKSDGKWLYFLGADDKLYNRNILANVFCNLKDNPKLIIGDVTYSQSDIYPFITNKKKQKKTVVWSWKLWIWNSIHHQGTFFKEEIFQELKYDINYPVLADYLLNLQLYKRKIAYKKINFTVAECSSFGVSKNGGWKLYKEEIKIKSKEGFIVVAPIFFLISIFKYFIRKIQNVRN